MTIVTTHPLVGALMCTMVILITIHCDCLWSVQQVVLECSQNCLPTESCVIQVTQDFRGQSTMRDTGSV